MSASATPKPPNSERYSHIPNAEIVKLSDGGKSHRQIAKILGMGPCSVGMRLRKAGKRRAPARVTDSQLKDARDDPAWQARHGAANPIVPVDRVVCLECGELKSELNANGMHSHLRKHRMTALQYTRQHPGARLTSYKRSRDQNHRQGRAKTIEDLMAEDAALYSIPKVREAARRDPNWEARHEITDFVFCRWPRCGLKSRCGLDNHLKTQHDCTLADYHARFPKAETIPLRLKNLRREAARDRFKDLFGIARVFEELKHMSLASRLIVCLALFDPTLTKPQIKQIAGKEADLSERQMTRLGKWLRERVPSWQGFADKDRELFNPRLKKIDPCK